MRRLQQNSSTGAGSRLIAIGEIQFAAQWVEAQVQCLSYLRSPPPDLPLRSENAVAAAGRDAQPPHQSALAREKMLYEALLEDLISQLPPLRQ